VILPCRTAAPAGASTPIAATMAVQLRRLMTGLQ
jgi:hypothetical protein